MQVKEELGRMRAQQSAKESAYRVMQRESQKVEMLQKELQKLKEGKVSNLLFSPLIIADQIIETHACHCLFLAASSFRRSLS